jgi:putative oxidoreductase
MFINSGLNKFFNYMPMPDPMPEDIMALFNAIMSLGWLLPLIGAAEVIGGILVIIPKTRALGAIIIFPVMVGVLLTHIVNVPATLPVALVLIAINLWIIFENREKYLPMVN